MEYKGIVIPGGVSKLVVVYTFYDGYNSREWRKSFIRIKDAYELYKRGIKYISSSDNYEEVGLYYCFNDGVLHLVQRYNSVWGYTNHGEME